MTSPPPLPIASAEQSSGSLVLQTETVLSTDDTSISSLTLPPLSFPYPSPASAFPAPWVYRQHPEALRSLSNSAGTTPPIYNSSRVPATHESSPAGNASAPYLGVLATPEFSSAGSLPSSHSRGPLDTSIAITSSLASPIPTFSARELTSLRHSNPSLPLSHSASNSTPWSSHEPPFLTPSHHPYGSLGVPIPLPPYQTLPTPDPSTSQLNLNRLVVEVNGIVFIRNAIPLALVREVVASINSGLSVVTKFKTLQIYGPSIEADKVRDEFILVFSLILLLFQGLISNSITEMPLRP